MFIKDVNSLAVLSGAQLPHFVRADKLMALPTYALQRRKLRSSHIPYILRQLHS